MGRSSSAMNASDARNFLPLAERYLSTSTSEVMWIDFSVLCRLLPKIIFSFESGILFGCGDQLLLVQTHVVSTYSYLPSYFYGGVYEEFEGLRLYNAGCDR